MRYLIMLRFPKPRPEHTRVAQALEHLGEGRMVFFEKHGCAYLVSTELSANDICGRMETAILDGDSVLVVEIGHDWATFGQNVAAGWLRSHASSP